MVPLSPCKGRLISLHDDDDDEMMKIDPVNPEITRVITAPFWMRWQKSAYLTEYLTNYWIDLHQRFSIGRHMYVDYKINISFVVVQRTLLW